MSTDRNPRQQATEAVSRKAQAVTGVADQVIEKTAATVAQMIGVEVPIDKELENLALPEDVWILIREPLETSGFSVRSDELKDDPGATRRVTRLVGTGSREHFLLHIKYSILKGERYYDHVATIAYSFPPSSCVCLFSQFGDGIHVNYSILFDEIWSARLGVRTVYLSWEQLLQINQEVDVAKRCQKLLDRMGIKSITVPKSASGKQEKVSDLPGFLALAFDKQGLRTFLRENGPLLSRIETETPFEGSEVEYCAAVVCKLISYGYFNSEVIEAFFDALLAEREEHETTILQLKEQYSPNKQ